MPTLRVSIRKQRQIVLAHKSGKSDEQVAALMGVTPPTVARVLVGHFFWEKKKRNNYEPCPGCGGRVNVWPCLECTLYPRVTVG